MAKKTCWRNRPVTRVAPLTVRRELRYTACMQQTTVADVRSFRRLTLRILLVAVLLLASHAGEFWPFSILPMFSHAGVPWTRTMVRDISGEMLDDAAAAGAEATRGTPFPLASIGVAQNDLAKLVLGFGDTLDDDEAALLASMFAEARNARRLLLVRVTGSLSHDQVTLRHVPFAILDHAGVRPVKVPP